MITVLPRGRCVQYQRNGGWRIGHVYGDGRTPGTLLVRESLTGDLLEVPASLPRDYPSEPIPEPVVAEADRWHYDDVPDTSQLVVGDYGHKLRVVRYGRDSAAGSLQWFCQGHEVFPPQRWRELSKEER